MGQQRRYLFSRELQASLADGYLAAQEEQLAACPAAAEYTDEEVEEFLHMALYLDSGTRKDITRSLRLARIAFPAELALDEYRLSRYLLRRWQEPAVREAFLQRGVSIDYALLAKLTRGKGFSGWLAYGDRFGQPVAIATMRASDRGDLIPAFKEAFSPEQAARYRALMIYGRLLLYRCLTEPLPPRQISPWERQKLLKRLRLRDLQLRSMRRSLYRLRRERKALLERLREAGRHENPEAAALARELQELRARQEEARLQHAAALQAQAERFERELDQVRAELVWQRQDHQQALALRYRWLSVPQGG